jgi:amidase
MTLLTRRLLTGSFGRIALRQRKSPKRVISSAAMSIQAPSVEQLREIAASLGFRMSDQDLACYLELMSDGLAAYSMIDALPDYLPSVRYPRGKGYRQQWDENRYIAL